MTDTYIDIADFSMLIGYNKKTNSKIFNEQIESLNENLILSYTLIDGVKCFYKNEVNNFIKNIVSFNSILKTIKISKQVLRRIIKENNIKHYKFGTTYDYMFLEKSDVEKFIHNSNLISINRFLMMIGYPKKSAQSGTYRSRLIEFISESEELQILSGYIHLKTPLYFKETSTAQEHVFSLSKVNKFIEQHVTLKAMIDELKMQNNNLVSLLTKKNIEILTFSSNPKYRFVHIEDYNYIKRYRAVVQSGASFTHYRHDRFIELQVENRTYIKEEVIEKLQLLSDYNLESILEEHKINEVETIETNNGSINFYCKTEINDLVNLQNKMFEDYSSKYYTWSDILKKYNHINCKGIINQSNIQSIECPFILRSLFSTHTLFSKKEVDDLLLKKEKDIALINVRLNCPFDEFKYKSEEILNAHFNDDIIETKKLWFDFAKNKLLNNDSLNKTPIINSYARISALFAETLTAEIYTYSPSSLNKTFFDERYDTISLTNKQIIYSFIIELSKTFQSKLNRTFLNTSMLNNPFEFEKTRVVDTSRYTLDEYKEIFEYSTNINLHKHKAINDVNSFLSNDPYLKYDSYWLYVMTHLTNNWRHSTIITELTAVDLSNTKISSLDWLIENDIDIDDANSIIFQIGLSLKNVHKTNVLTEFRISETLKIPFATAVAICQLRNERTGNGDAKLLNLNPNYTIQSHHSVHKSFFKSFRQDFKFSNRKMNKTLTTLIWSVFEDLNVAKVSRSHMNETTTLDYIKLSDEQLTELIYKLFANNNFGYITNLLTDTLFNQDISGETNFNDVLYQTFGDSQKIEVSSGIINRLSTDYDDLIKLSNELSNREKEEILIKSMTNTLYSKQKYYQCIFSECKYINEDISLQDCSSCAYSIVNVYALSNLMDMYLNGIYDLINKFPTATTHGDKIKKANQFYLLWSEIQKARDKFGDSIYEFVSGGKERFNELATKLPQTKEFLTIK